MYIEKSTTSIDECPGFEKLFSTSSTLLSLSYTGPGQNSLVHAYSAQKEEQQASVSHHTENLLGEYTLSKKEVVPATLDDFTQEQPRNLLYSPPSYQRLRIKDEVYSDMFKQIDQILANKLKIAWCDPDLYRNKRDLDLIEHQWEPKFKSTEGNTVIETLTLSILSYRLLTHGKR